MAETSTYVQLSKYALVEYIYSSESIITTDARLLRIKNSYKDEYQFVNSSSAVNITGNVLDRSASKMGIDTTWAYQDIDVPAPIIQIDPNFTLTDLTSLTITTQKYDTVKVHFVAGYDFSGMDGIITEIQWEEWTINGRNGRKFTAGSQVYIKSEQTINFNTDPLFLGDRFYDRYIEFKVPSLAEVNYDFWNSPSASNTFGYQYTFNNVGFSKTSQIFANIYEINATEETNGNRYFKVGNTFNSSFNSADTYSYLGCVVKENTEYDFIEYYPTFNNGFIADYLANINQAPGGDWVVINQINVYEQAGTTMIRTSSNTLLQESNFDEPAIFRPVIRNAAYVYSFTVEYIMRLLNKVDNNEIIRKSTFTSSYPKKYGYSLEKINVLEGFRPVKVYNKIEKIDSSALQNSILDNKGVFGFGSPKIMSQNIYVNNYYDVNNISVDSTTNVGDIIGQTVYAQGLNYIFINKFDNYVKFKIFTKSADKKQNTTLNFASTGMNAKLAFILDDDTKVYLDPVQDMNGADPGAGELLFKIDDILSTKLLNEKIRDYYIINKNDKGDEVLIYSGKYESQDKKLETMAIVNKTIIDDLGKQIAKLKTAQDQLLKRKDIGSRTTTASSPSVATSNSPATAVSEQNQLDQSKKIEEANIFVSNESKGTENAIQQAAASSSIENPQASLNIPEIPGVTPSLGAPISSATKPKVLNPGRPGVGMSPFRVLRNVTP